MVKVSKLIFFSLGKLVHFKMCRLWKWFGVSSAKLLTLQKARSEHKQLRQIRRRKFNLQCYVIFASTAQYREYTRRNASWRKWSFLLGKKIEKVTDGERKEGTGKVVGFLRSIALFTSPQRPDAPIVVVGLLLFVRSFIHTKKGQLRTRTRPAHQQHHRESERGEEGCSECQVSFGFWLVTKTGKAGRWSVAGSGPSGGLISP